MEKKIAILSMDVEDWYHLEYFKGFTLDRNQSLLDDGVEKFYNILEYNKIKGVFFVVGDIYSKIKFKLLQIYKSNHEIAYHSKSHELQYYLDDKQFIDELYYSKSIIKDLNLKKIGFRAPCFCLGRDKLDILMKSNLFSYDSSLIKQKEHPLYKKLEIEDFKNERDSVYRKNNFYEFEVSTYKFLGFNIPISGGGYLRIIPWFIYKYFLNKYLINNKTYIFYIHPFELSSKNISLPSNISFFQKFRFNYNRKKTRSRIQKTINLLHKHGFEFKTFNDFLNEDINNRS